MGIFRHSLEYFFLIIFLCPRMIQIHAGHIPIKFLFLCFLKWKGIFSDKSGSVFFFFLMCHIRLLFLFQRWSKLRLATPPSIYNHFLFLFFFFLNVIGIFRHIWEYFFQCHICLLLFPRKIQIHAGHLHIKFLLFLFFKCDGNFSDIFQTHFFFLTCHICLLFFLPKMTQINTGHYPIIL